MEKDIVLFWIFIAAVIAVVCGGAGIGEMFDAYIKMSVEVAKIQAGCKT